MGGALLALAALALWTAYGVANAAVLKRPGAPSAARWASMQGAALLPACLPLLAWRLLASDEPLQPPGLARFALVSAALGVLAGWLAARLWNAAAPRLPTALAAQLVAVETMAALLYAAALEGAWPPAPALAGAVIPLAGVALALRAFHRPGSG